MRVSDLQTKDVVNVADGSILGQVCDVELLLPSGRVQALVVPGAMRWFGLRMAGSPLVIPWQQIEQVGSDVILVRLDPDRGDSVAGVDHSAIRPLPIHRHRGKGGTD
ncbi:YlmC/YmxH family sporulation protein [Pasteuria penetrans]|uniref:YlmC/YmxH family sporulation protein n=1 Tax=Pasteuria penetrans TaxID=86005 RepID=UPI000FC22490|nr:YlmC/YmxH family sporulation protein [Pasteuria penetrans]